MDIRRLDQLARISRKLRVLQFDVCGLGQGNADLAFPVEEAGARHPRADVDTLIAEANTPRRLRAALAAVLIRAHAPELALS